MVAELVALGIAIVVAFAELLHARRCRQLRRLAFGPSEQPATWARFAPLIRIASATALAWGMAALVFVPPKTHSAEGLKENEQRHLMMVLDVSPSMRLQDAGPERKQSRMERASSIMESFFKRVHLSQYKISVVAVYNGAKPVVVDTKDVEVVRNILNDLPMHYAFISGKTKLFDGLEEAAKIAKPWQPRSTTLLLISDGDTVPATGMPRMPTSVSEVVVVGVGDPKTGKFIDGRQSRQDTATLRQIATRLSGVFHNGNESHLSSDLLKQLAVSTQPSRWDQLSRREFALLAVAIGGLCYAFLPVFLAYFGSRWKPGLPSSVQPKTSSVGNDIRVKSEQRRRAHVVSK